VTLRLASLVMFSLYFVLCKERGQEVVLQTPPQRRTANSSPCTGSPGHLQSNAFLHISYISSAVPELLKNMSHIDHLPLVASHTSYLAQEILDSAWSGQLYGCEHSSSHAHVVSKVVTSSWPASPSVVSGARENLRGRTWGGGRCSRSTRLIQSADRSGIVKN
jgi:hypothetical protein